MLYSALIGNPVALSVTPVLYCALAEQVGIEYAHLKIPVAEASRLADVVAALETIGCVGINVTIPFKVSAMSLVDTLDPSTDVGAVNTVTFRDGRRVGYNTDRSGAARAIADELRPIEADDRVVLLGAGGAARAIVGVCRDRSARVAVLSLWPEESAALVCEMDPDRRTIEDAGAPTHETLVRLLADADFLINATPVGSAAGPAGSLVPPGVYEELARVRNMADLNVFDVIYKPVHTELLWEAHRAGARVCSGLWMLINQGVESFGLLVGLETSAFDRTPLFALLTNALKSNPRQ